MIEVRSLVGKETLDLSILGLKTLLDKTDKSIRLVVHGDGSLNKKDRDRIRGLGSSVEVIERCGIEEKVLEEISEYEMSLKYRKNNILGMKLFDVITLSKQSTVHYVDSDIFFLKQCDGIFDLEDGADAVFSSNGRMNHAYSVCPLDVRPLGNIRVPRSINTGLFSIRKDKYDLNHIEHALRVMSDNGGKFTYRPFWVEQTCWASLALKINSKVWSFDNITIPQKKWVGKNSHYIAPPKAKIGAIHFTSGTRHLLDIYGKWESNKRIRTESRTISDAYPHNILASDLLHALKRRL